ncbi:hypothetical protein K0M31_005429 [Melipona bicolor]|uniref:Uncharacterized protein n=1 Tax=Melipona bicolor TaxID=60889 RepID=A0AA40FVL1_9HYME|nr:hypothetical protein K0M31_005429 [Melipona bicolor]
MKHNSPVHSNGNTCKELVKNKRNTGRELADLATPTSAGQIEIKEGALLLGTEHPKEHIKSIEINIYFRPIEQASSSKETFDGGVPPLHFVRRISSHQVRLVFANGREVSPERIGAVEIIQDHTLRSASVPGGGHNETRVIVGY